MANEKKLSSIEKRLILFSTVIRLGHEAFKKDSVRSVVFHILNHSRSLLPYDRCALLDCRDDGSLEISGVMGESEVKQDSEYCLQLKKLFPAISEIREAVIINEETFAKYKLPQKSLDAFRKYFGSEQFLVLPLTEPGRNEIFAFWIVEFLEPLRREDILLNLFAVLTTHYSEALWYRMREDAGFGGGPSFRKRRLKHRFFSPRTLFLLIIAVFVFCLFYVKVPIQAVADFEFKPKQDKIVYAPYSGTVREVFYESGAMVRNNDIILDYETEDILYDLAVGQKQLAKTLAELDLAKIQSFDKVEYRGKVKILDLRRQLEENKIKKYKWYLSRSKIAAGANGTLIIGDKTILTGKKVDAGEKLFDVVSQHDVYAEIYLDEKDAVVLGENLNVCLYPHLRPEAPLAVRVVSISPIPLRNDNRRFTYRLKAVLETKKDLSFSCGMRGIAVLSSSKVRLGYYLFRSAIIWWRKQ